MIKRITSFLLCSALAFTIISSLVIPSYAASEMKTSEQGIEYIKSEEGFASKPYWDYAQYTVGYGTKCPADKYSTYKENGITKEEAEELLRTHLEYTEKDLNTKLIDKYNLVLSQNQFDALVSFSFNVGTGWITSSQTTTIRSAIISGDIDDITYALSLYCTAGGDILPSLVRRRLCEANMYTNNIYSKTQGDNYAYVYYEPNGGELTYKIQGYQVSSMPTPVACPAYEGREFMGWYTSQVGGEVVDCLTKELNGSTLYARWDTEEIVEEETKEPVTVKVTGTGVNLREGPGVNYKAIGVATIGDTFTITNVESGSGYKWGQFERGWICLKYTNYDAVLRGEIDNTTDVPNQDTDDNINVPEVDNESNNDSNEKDKENNATGNDTQDGSNSSVSGNTTKPNNQESTYVEGKVKVSDCLCVRSGAGTNYTMVGRLYSGDGVKIYEQKTTGGMTWGRIGDDKWVCLNYVVISSKDDNNGGSASNNSSSNSSSSSNDNPDVSDSTTDSQAIIKGTVSVQDCLRIRSGPGSSYKIVGHLYPGATVKITERKTVGDTVWGKVSNGWVSMSYINVDGETDAGKTETKAETKTIIADCLRIRKEAGTIYKIVGYLYEGDRVEILETKIVDGVKWGRVSQGWVSMQYAE